jgi:hypothetical protein
VALRLIGGPAPPVPSKAVVVLAELEIFCSRPHAPTRRVALGDTDLPCEPPPGFGGVLLAGVVAAHVRAIDPDHLPDLSRLTRELEDGRRIPQPRLRHRLQADTIGLNPVRHQLRGDGERLWFHFQDGHAPEQQVLGAVYAAGRLDPHLRTPVMAAIRRAIGWAGPVGADFIAAMAGAGRGTSFTRTTLENPTVWALGVMGFEGALADALGAPSAREVVRRYRELLREAHPDHGAETAGAAQRIADLTEARRILTGR